ncbi:MAG: hypothetical protein EZS28_012035 [Streblomastix strix]|uniref:Uncharacterized protein n=1 Tax=Streblomastix strix TaxID=222440 RepID=A0A5J4WC90_9EUKA|nr:MAG: hypothetical protein EZS28_012035 [Streblomastix strix]
MQEKTIMDTKEKIVAPDIKADGSVGAKRYKDHLRIAEAKRLFQRIYDKKFDGSHKVIDSNKYEDETIPQHYEVSVIRFNSSNYRFEGMNQEKYSETNLLSSDRTWLSHLQAFDINKKHYFCGNTDSMTWGISGNPEEDYRQKFKYVIKDQKFFDENCPHFFGQYKQLLGVSYEAEGTACFALAPKIHYIYNPLPNENEKNYNYCLK